MAMKVLGKMVKGDKINLITIEKMAYLIKRQQESGIKIKEYEVALMLNDIK
jgi:hypothetical protein